MLKKILYLYHVLTFSLIFADEAFLDGKTIVGIEGVKGYPPFVYENKETGEYEGYSVDLLNSVFEGSGAEMRYELLPWERGLEYVRRGFRADIALAAASTEERRRQYLFSDTIAEVHLAYFYDKRRFPSGLSVQEPEDFLRIGEIWGMKGYVYEQYGIPKRIDQYANSFQQLVDQLVHGRCDVILVRYEVFHSFKRVYPEMTGLEYIEGKIIPWRKAHPIRFYFLTARDSEFHSRLIDYINRRMLEMRSSGEMKRLKARHGLLVE